jgi:hypothetical protein
MNLGGADVKIDCGLAIGDSGCVDCGLRIEIADCVHHQRCAHTVDTATACCHVAALKPLDPW